MLLLALSFSVVSNAFFIATDYAIVESPYALPIPTIDIFDLDDGHHFKSNQTSLTLTDEVSVAIYDYIEQGRSSYTSETFSTGYLVSSDIQNVGGTQSWSENIYYGNRPTFSDDPLKGFAGYGCSFGFSSSGYTNYSLILGFERITHSPTYSEGHSFIYQDNYFDDIVRCEVSGTAYTVHDGGLVTSNDFHYDATQEIQDASAIGIDYIIDDQVGVGYSFYDVYIFTEYEGQGLNLGPQFSILYDVTALNLDESTSVYCPSFISYEANALTFPTPVSYADFNLLDWLGTAVEGFITTPLFIVGEVTVTIGGLLGLVFGFWIFIAFIKKFAGG